MAVLPRPAALIGAGARGECPACHARTLFSGPVRFADRCAACGEDFTRFNVGDGPAGLLTLAVGALMTVLALTVELNFHPPLWVHALLWFPLTILAVVGGLRVAKAVLLHLEYRHDAREGRLRPGPEQP